MNKLFIGFVPLVIGIVMLCACERNVPVEPVDVQDPVEVDVPQTPEVPETPEAPETPATPEEPEVYPAVPIALSAADKGVRDASNSFGLTVFGKLLEAADSERDILFSPLSLSLALSMAAEGAAGDTYDQFCKVLGLGESSREDLGAFYEKMIAGLVEADKSVSFTSSNSLWAAKSLGLKEAYAELLAKSFAAESFSVDFSLPETLGMINDWCATKTDGKIQKMLDEVDEMTRLILINALLFKAPWCIEWGVEKNRPFQGIQSTADKDYLHYDGEFRYRSFEGFSVAGVRYGNGKAFEMDVILPEEGKSVRDILGLIDSSSLSRMQWTPVDLYLPKFSLDYSTEDTIPACLQEMGLKLPFSSVSADFSGISDAELFISKIVQKSRIDVSENGTEFAAVTEIELRDSYSGPGETPEKVVFDANRPFAFLIREVSSDAILLMGTLSK